LALPFDLSIAPMLFYGGYHRLVVALDSGDAVQDRWIAGCEFFCHVRMLASLFLALRRPWDRGWRPGVRGATPTVVKCRRSRWMLIATAHELVQREGNFVRMRCAPSNNTFQLDGVVGYGADFDQLGFDDLRVSH
jgi:hypothetical protein